MKTLRLFGSEGGIFNKKIEINLPDDCIGISFACGEKKQAPKGIPENIYYHTFDKKETKDVKHGRIASIYYSWGSKEGDLEIIDHSGSKYRV